MLFKRILKYLIKKYVFKHEMGNLELGYGKHTLFIQTLRSHNEIWITLQDRDLSSCDVENEDLVSATPIEKGFILYADIKSNCTKVKWEAV